MLLVGLAAVVFVIVVLPFLVVAGIFIIEVALIALLLPIVTVGRALFIGRWPIVVRRDGDLVLVKSVRGWAASRREMDSLATTIRTGFTVA